MNIKQLEFFLTTVTQGSIAGAARKLDVAQPSVSQQIGNLERSIGASLLVRNHSGVYTTEAGEIFAEHARNILSEFSEAKTKLNTLAGGHSQTLKVAMMPSIGNALTIPLIEHIEDHFQHIDLDISTGPSYSILGWLQHSKVDVALGFEQSFSASYMNAVPLIEECMYLVVGTSQTSTSRYGALLELDAIEFWRLPEYELLIPNEKDALGIFVRKYEKSTGIKLRHNKAYGGQLLTGLRQVMMGKGLTILPSSAAYHLEEAGKLKLIKIIAPCMNRRVLAMTNKNAPTSSVSQFVIAEIKTLIKGLNREGIWRGDMC